MRLVWVLLFLIVVGVVFDWAVKKGKEEQKRVFEKPRSEQYIVGNLDRGKIGAATIQVHDYKNAFLQFKLTKGRNPSNLKELVDEGYIQPGAEFDPFGQPYELQYQGRKAVISSPGADRVRGTPDDIVQEVLVD